MTDNLLLYMDFDDSVIIISINQCVMKIYLSFLYYQDVFQVQIIYLQYFWEHIWINDY